MGITTTTSFRLTEKENGILQNILNACPFLKQSKSAALRYALFYWASNPKCPRCGTELEPVEEHQWFCGTCYRNDAELR